MKIITENVDLQQEDKVLFDSKFAYGFIVVQMGDMQFRIRQDSVIIDREEVECLYVNFIDRRGADRLHILPAASNSIHLTGGR